MPYVEVICRAHLVDGVIQRMLGRHRSERALDVSRMIRTVRAEITTGEVEPSQRITRALMGVSIAMAMAIAAVAIATVV